jgi:hypothetical protein
VTTTITVARLDRAIELTARAMTLHDLPQLLPTLKRLEAERDRLATGEVEKVFVASIKSLFAYLSATFLAAN